MTILCNHCVTQTARFFTVAETVPYSLPLYVLKRPIIDMQTQDTTTQATERLITKADAAKRLSISTRTLDRIAESGLVEKIFVRGSVRFKLSVIESIIQNGI